MVPCHAPEFVIAVPFILGACSSLRSMFGISMLRQVMLDRAMDLAVREVRAWASCDGQLICYHVDEALCNVYRSCPVMVRSRWRSLSAPARRCCPIA